MPIQKLHQHLTSSSNAALGDDAPPTYDNCCNCSWHLPRLEPLSQVVTQELKLLELLLCLPAEVAAFTAIMQEVEPRLRLFSC